jgi:nucleoside-diphosphate-sugar epimerase
MTPLHLNQHKQQIVARIAADLVLTNASAILALGLPVLYYTILGDGSAAVSLARSFRTFYLDVFIALSVMFPLAFLLNGLYTKSPAEERRKPLLVLRGIFSGALLFVLGSYLFSSRIPSVPTMTMLCIVVLAVAVSARFAKAAVVKHVSIELNQHTTAVASRDTVLVVGAAGYIGSILVRRLLEKGYHVRILDSMIYGDDAIREILGDRRVELQIGDCRNITSVISAVNGVQSIIHLAAIVGDPACDLDHNAALEINYAATRMLIEVAKGHKVGSFIFASSCSVYGATPDIMDESSATYPLSVYAQTKIDSEQALLDACNDTFRPIIVRLATVFGNSWRPRFDLVVNLLTAQAHAEETISIYNGEQWRPFIHVADVARGIIALLEAPRERVGGHVFNLGDSRLNYTLSDVAARIRREYPDAMVNHIDNNDRRNYRVSFDKIRTATGFTCNFDLDYGIRELKAALEDGRIKDYKDPRHHNQRYLRSQATRTMSASPIDTKVMAAFASFAPSREVLTHAATV